MRSVARRRRVGAGRDTRRRPCGHDASLRGRRTAADIRRPQPPDPGAGRPQRTTNTGHDHPLPGARAPLARRCPRRADRPSALSAGGVRARVRGHTVSVPKAVARVGRGRVHRRRADLPARERERAGWPQRGRPDQSTAGHAVRDHRDAARLRELDQPAPDRRQRSVRRRRNRARGRVRPLFHRPPRSGRGDPLGR